MRGFSAKGSAPPVRSAARLYGQSRGQVVEIEVCGQACVRRRCTAETEQHGFVPEVAAGDYDLAVAGSEADMDDLEQAGMVASGSRRSLGLREVAILVPAGNPGQVSGLGDLGRPGVRIAISTIDCLRGAWEDVCGRAGCVEEVRRNISLRVTGCMALVEAIRKGRVDAAIGWTSFVHFHSNIAAIPLPREFRVYRSTCGAILERARNPEVAASFLDFLRSPDCREIFTRHGWVYEGAA